MTTGRIFADNGLLGSFFSLPFFLLSSQAASLPLSSLTWFRRSLQTTKLSAGRDALGLLPDASAVNFHRTSVAFERTRLPKLIPHECHTIWLRENPNCKNRRFIPGNEKIKCRTLFTIGADVTINFHSSIYNLLISFFLVHYITGRKSNQRRNWFWNDRAIVLLTYFEFSKLF